MATLLHFSTAVYNYSTKRKPRRPIASTLRQFTVGVVRRMWEFIVIGAGTAGCVMAAGLTSSGRQRVLLLEAGGKPTLPVRMPAGMVKLFRSSADWAFQSEPQDHCSGRIVFTPRGKMLGGSANMNAQIHQWCHPADFDGWERSGALGWGWRHVAPVFQAMESSYDDSGADFPRGRTGPMLVSRLRTPHPLAHGFVAAARCCGFQGTPDYNGFAFHGAWLVQLAHRHGTRFSVYDAYLAPALRRRNLEVRQRCQVARLLVEQGRVVGVVLVEDQQRQVLRARRGVVLCAGAIGSPQLLMLSGIGPAEALRNLGIPVAVDSPELGSNLQDHPIAPLIWRTRRSDTHMSADSPLELLKWLLFRRGLLASNVVEAIAFTSLADQAGPDLELLLATVQWREQALAQPQLHAYTIGTAVVSPRSRGRVWLRSASPYDPPRIDLGLLNDAEGVDAQVLLAGARLARQIAASPPLSLETLDEFAPGNSVVDDDELLGYLKSHIQTVYHPAGTCRMGDDARAPVDVRLRVRGVDGLWLADASVMPTVPRGHPNAVVAMIAQRGAEWINEHALHD